jgi:hypothetical protein
VSGKAILCCVGLKPVCRLRGFANIAFADLRMTVHGIGIHVHENGSSRKARRLDHKNRNAEDVLTQMRTRARLLLHYSNGKPTWLLNLGGAVAPETALDVIKHIDVCAVGDCLFADCLVQTFRYAERLTNGGEHG